MHRFVAGICQIDVQIIPKEPWAVRGPALNSDQRNKVHVLLDHQRKPFLPASSLKGVLRSTAERILRSMEPERSLDLVPLADIPFVHDKASLTELRRGEIADSELLEWHEQCMQAHKQGKLAASVLTNWESWSKQYAEMLNQPDHLYLLLSPSSQLFGCTLHAGLVTLDDAYPEAKQCYVEQTHVAISRFTGGAGRKLLFSEEVAVAQTPLTTTLRITNFALWQIGLLALVFQEINLGYVGIGSGIHKGHGQVSIVVNRITCTYNEQAYATGIISAQARLSKPPWKCNDVPHSVIQVEGELQLMQEKHLLPARGNWQQDGMIQFVLDQNDAITSLFKEAVEKAWCKWVILTTQKEKKHAEESL